MDLKLATSKLFYRALGFVIYAAVAVAFLGAAGQALSDVLAWLKTAHGSGYTNSRLLYDAGIVNQQTGWLGLQKILDDLLDWPAWSGLLVAGGILLIIGIRVTTKLDEINRIERHRRQ